MSVPALEPYATQQRWQAVAPLAGEVWQALLADYLAALARACDAAGPCLIGHIKLLALFDSGDYLRVSAVSTAHAPTVDGHVPDGLDTISVVLNLLVYGLPTATLRGIAWDTAKALTHGEEVTVTEEPPGNALGGHRSAHPRTHASWDD